MIQPDRVTDNVRRKAMALVAECCRVQAGQSAKEKLTCQNRLERLLILARETLAGRTVKSGD